MRPRGIPSISGKARERALLWISGYCALPLTAVLLSVLLLAACSGVQREPPIQVWPDMKKQDKYKPQAGSPLFSDGRAMRAPVPGTIARDREPEVDAVMNTGMLNGQYVGKMPVKIDADLLKIGQQKFNIYCAPCHDKAGSGKGIVAIRTPAWQPTNLHELRLVNTADGDIFWTITNGRRSMPAYKYQISDPRDRWAVVAYVRALQRSWLGTMQDLPQTLRAEVR